MNFFLSMHPGIFLIVIPVIIACLDHLSKRTFKRIEWQNTENMPHELRKSKLFLSEIDLSVSEPVRLCGRIDQVFITGTNLLIPLDTKVRSKRCILNSDIEQLSIYKLMLSMIQDMKVSDYGYIRLVDRYTRNKRYIKVDLLSNKDTIAMIKERI